jgi:hypothetical protein
MAMLIPGVQGQQQFVSVDESAIRVIRRDDGWIAGIPFQIHKPYHIQEVSGAQENVIPTTISFEKSEHLEIVKYEFTSLKYDTVYLDHVPSRVLSDTFEVSVFLKFPSGHSEGIPSLKGGLDYQACNDRQCFFPRTLEFNIPLKE